MSDLAKKMVLEFGRLFQEKLGERYPPTWGRDMRMMGEWAESYGEERVKRMLKAYFDTPRKIYSIPFFKVALAELMQKERKEEKKEVMPETDNWRFK